MSMSHAHIVKKTPSNRFAHRTQAQGDLKNL